MIGSNNQDYRNIPELWSDINRDLVLDLGCGMGLYARELARRGARAVAMDQDRTTLAVAKLESKGVFWICADADHLPFRENIFDRVVSVEVLSHIHPQMRMRVFVEMERVMVPGGIAYFTLHNSARLSLSQWLRLKRARDMYATNKLNVWPSLPRQTPAMLSDSALVLEPRVMYLNYHSRFTYAFYLKHPWLSKCVTIVEEVLRQMPIASRLAITFLQIVKKGK